MNIAIWIITGVIWYICGIRGFVYWWTTEWDFTINKVGVCLFVGISGPLAWLIGYFIHGSKKEPKILIKRKDINKKEVT